ncbi:MAG: 5'-nucleotidase [Fibrobacter sp.]|nr:5'-nucleotidase [Fibrobacter sp.]
MPYPIERKLVVGVSSNALFNLEKEHDIFESKGLQEYRKYQIEHKTDILNPGMAFPFIRRFLNINKVYSDELPVEVVLFSKNSPETGVRIFNSIRHYELDITRAAFTSGQSPYKYIPAFNISLFISTDMNDVQNAINANLAAGRILKTNVVDDDESLELRVAFDFDGVIADDEAENIYKTDGLKKYLEYESSKAMIPHRSGLLADFFRKLSYFQMLETKKQESDPGYKKFVKTTIITARNAPAHERAFTTLSNWGVTVDEMFLLGGIDKRRILEVIKPHLFLDDQLIHLDTSMQNIPLVHIPFRANTVNPGSE